MERIVTEVAVIGAGPGGYPAAFALADKGKKVTLIDPEANPGGVCLYRGWHPFKGSFGMRQGWLKKQGTLWISV